VLVTSSLAQTFALLTVALAALAALSDLRSGRIPNRLVLSFALMVLGLRALGVALSWLPASTLLDDMLYGALIAACVPCLLYLRGGLGAGDLKLLVVCGAALGPLSAAHLQLYAFLLATGFVLARLSYRGVLFRSAWRSLRTFARRRAIDPAALDHAPEALRFAPAVLVAALLVLVERWS
jgi:Flp pilus assembly protein protease CpaA